MLDGQKKFSRAHKHHSNTDHRKERMMEDQQPGKPSTHHGRDRHKPTLWIPFPGSVLPFERLGFRVQATSLAETDMARPASYVDQCGNNWCRIRR